jgi:hypothetical protein
MFTEEGKILFENNEYEYMINIWGGAWNKDADPSVEKDFGIKKGAHYFKTKEERDNFCKILSRNEYKKQGIVIESYEGYLTHKRTVFVGKYKYEDKEFIIRNAFNYEYPTEAAEYMHTQGNYSCPYNISIFIKEQYGEDAIPKLDCCDDDKVELIDYHIEYID